MTMQPPPPPLQPGPPPPAGQGAMPPYAPPATPAGLHAVRFGGFWIRLVAYIIDAVITGAVTYGILFAVKPITCITADGTTCLPDTTTIAPVFWAIVAIPVVYLVALWATGGTVGQRLLGLRVVRADNGRQLGIGRALLRLLGYVLASAVVDIGLIWAAFDSRKQGWHDKIAGSLVIHKA